MTEAQESQDATGIASGDTITPDNQGDMAEAQKPEGVAEGATGNTAEANSRGGITEKREPEIAVLGKRPKFQTKQSFQYIVLCILCDLHKIDKMASLTASELAAEVNKRHKSYRVDKDDCYKAINDLKIVLAAEQPDWEITTGNYRLIGPRYGRAEKLKVKFLKMK